MVISPWAPGVSIIRGVLNVLITGAVISTLFLWMWLNSVKNIRSSDDAVALFTFEIALRYAGYFFTSTLPGLVASGNPSANGASPSAGLGSTFDASCWGSSARVGAAVAPSNANTKNKTTWRMIGPLQVCRAVATHCGDPRIGRGIAMIAYSSSPAGRPRGLVSAYKASECDCLIDGGDPPRPESGGPRQVSLRLALSQGESIEAQLSGRTTSSPGGP